MDWIKELLTLFWDYLKCWILIDYYQRGVVLHKGKFKKELDPGLYFKIPFLEYCLDTNVQADTKEYGPRSITTLDGKTISIAVMVEFEIDDVKRYLVENNDSASNMQDIALAEMSDLLEDIEWDAIKKKTTKNALRKAIAEKYKSLGVNLKDLKFTTKSETNSYTIFSSGDKII